ncbi:MULTISPECIES: hypothetical protein [Deefgea]|uniref:Type IV pilus modification protein PilV n=1 Tax=Deefgea chitinilytica TaxID=570276 RepID=A0ABS2CFG2_9NEIS|nr:MULTISPECIES: hypothetical protein [Deefgea]MBM5572885.1 hypothetical protein [Deefgea chitinilytica]MBM9890122.1 hypothetical protein [Deefgea sp. CFH1-16]
MKQSGTIMLEVLISIVVLALGILGLASLQAYSLRAAQSSNLRSIAADLASSMAEQIQTNRPKSLAATEAGIDSKYYGSSIVIPIPPNYAHIKCEYDNSTEKYTCSKPTGYTPNSKTKTNSQKLAEEETAYWLNLINASLPLGFNSDGTIKGGGIVCKDNTPDDGISPVFDPTDTDYATKTGCLSSTSAEYENAPYVIKIWYEEQTTKKEQGTLSTDDIDEKDKNVRVLRRFSSSLL